MNYRRLINVILSVLLIFTQSGLAIAEEQINWINGPKTVDVGSNLAKLKIPEKYVFADGNDTKKVMEHFGNPITDNEVGMVVPKDQTKTWFMLFDYDQLGYVEDDEAKNLDSEGLLESLKAGTEVDNEARKDQGLAPINLVGWDEKPHYDSKTHNVVWSILAESQGERLINYNVRILGRHGMTSVTLVADPKELATIKPEIETIVNNFEYVSGEKYEDYIPGQDQAADLSLTALIASESEEETVDEGFFGKLLSLFKKFWFILVGGVVVLFIIFKRYFGKRAKIITKKIKRK